MTAPSGLVIRWMSFAEFGDQILMLRRQVFMEGQGYDEAFTKTPYDDDGLHLGAFDGQQLISVLSIFVFDDDKGGVFARYGLPRRPGRVVQYSKRAEAESHRGHKIGALLAVAMIRAIYEVLRPRGTFLALQGTHTKLQAHYATVFGFDLHGTVTTPEGRETVVMLLSGAEALRKQYFSMRLEYARLSAEFDVKVPSLVRFLELTGRSDLIPMDVFVAENLYSAPLSLRDELPRLSMQTRILFAEQKSRIEAVDFPPPPARLLDVGCGPGVYISMLAQASKFKGYELMGLDIYKEMVTYARLNRPNMTWVHTSVYDTKQPDLSVDVVHANFLFIHLLSPSLALREILRILKPGGMLYVVDVNDSTFEGPPVIADLIKIHHERYEGDRCVLNDLPFLASEYGLTLTQRFSSRVSNLARSSAPEFLKDEVHLDHIKMWGLFSFLGQREDLSEYFSRAQDFYLSTGPTISVCVQTQIYHKPA